MKTSLLYKSLAITALGIGAAVSTSAFAVGTGLPFKVNEGVVPGSAANIVTADSITIAYNATVTSTGVGGTFDESGFITMSSFNLGGSAALSQLNGFGAGGYKMYGVFNFTGTTTLVGTTLTFKPTNPASISIYLDPNANSTFTLPGTGAGAVTVANSGDDLLLGTANTLANAEGHVFASLANGDFEGVYSDWTLTPLGQSFFFDPAPFYMTVDLNGNTTTITPGASLGPFTAKFDGQGGVFFVPEPATLALFGMGLLGLGAATSRRKK